MAALLVGITVFGELSLSPCLSPWDRVGCWLVMLEGSLDDNCYGWVHTVHMTQMRGTVRENSISGFVRESADSCYDYN